MNRPPVGAEAGPQVEVAGLQAEALEAGPVEELAGELVRPRENAHVTARWSAETSKASSKIPKRGNVRRCQAAPLAKSLPACAARHAHAHGNKSPRAQAEELEGVETLVAAPVMAELAAQQAALAVEVAPAALVEPVASTNAAMESAKR